MKNELHDFYLLQPEPAKSCLFELRQLILRHKPAITEAWKYKMPFFLYKNRMFCYLWINRKTTLPYIGFVDGNKMDHPRLVANDRARMKVMTIDPLNDIPVRTIRDLLNKAVAIKDVSLPKHKKTSGNS